MENTNTSLARSIMSEGKNQGIVANFSLVAGESGDIAGRVAFWDAPSTVQWFRDHGYVLYQRGPPVIDNEPSPFTLPSHSSTESSAADYPYAHYDLTRILRAKEPEAKVVFAQNSLNHHVAIKLVKADTDELKILQFLKTVDLNVLRENCVIPVLDILPIEGFSFVVMPRWGIYPFRPWPQTLRELLWLMHSKLRALNFLHEHNIAHRDINEGNFLVNHCVDDDYVLHSTIRGELRSQDRLLYAIFDFDQSVKLQPGADRSQFRLPYYKSWGTYNVVSDTAQGEYDFNPFIFDVGALGVIFCRRFQHLTPQIPIFAPFLDRLTTRNLSFRFTASEALSFFETIILPSFSTAQLEQEIASLNGKHAPRYDTYDRWEHLPPEFIRQWKHYREPPLPWRTTLLRRICLQSWACHTVPRIRRLLDWISSPFRHN